MVSRFWLLRQFSGAESYSQAVALPTENSLFPLKDKKVCCALLVKCTHLLVDSLTCFALAVRLPLQLVRVQ